jgi:hypothetical protein
MQIPLPDRFVPRYVFIFITVLFAGELIQGTDFIFAVMVAIFVALWAAAFNVSGGVSYTSGAFIFFVGILTVVGAAVAKLLLLEAADSHLQTPRTTMACYCVAMAGTLAASFVSRALRPATGLLKDFDSLEKMRQASIVSLIIGILITYGSGSSSAASGSLVTAIRQINFFPFMTVLLATTYEIRSSNGRRSMNWIVAAGIAFNVASGLFTYSKEGILIGPACWFLAAAIQRYEFSRAQLVTSVLGFAFANYYLVPYSQYVRVYAASSRTENFAVALHYLEDLNETRRLYYEVQEENETSGDSHFFDTSQPFLERAIILPADDAIIAYTEQGHLFGITPTITAYFNIVPHVLWPNKPNENYENSYAHELGILADEDYTTGISFSPVGDVFHEASWLGLLLLLPVNMFLAFLIDDTIAGSARYSPWGLIWIIHIAHVGPEGGIGGIIWFFTYGVVGMAFQVVMLKHVGPFVIDTIFPKRVEPLRDRLVGPEPSLVDG